MTALNRENLHLRTVEAELVLRLRELEERTKVDRLLNREALRADEEVMQIPLRLYSMSALRRMRMPIS